MDKAFVTFNSDYSIYGEYPDVWEDIRFGIKEDKDVLDFFKNGCERILNDISTGGNIMVGIDDNGFTIVNEAGIDGVSGLRTYYDAAKSKYCFKCDSFASFQVMTVFYLIALRMVDAINYAVVKTTKGVSGVSNLPVVVPPPSKEISVKDFMSGMTLVSYDLPVGSYTFHKLEGSNFGITLNGYKMESMTEGAPPTVEIVCVANQVPVGNLTINYARPVPASWEIPFEVYNVGGEGLTDPLSVAQKLAYGLPLDARSIIAKGNPVDFDHLTIEG